MDLRVLLLEFVSLVCFLFYEVEGHANIALSLRPEIQELIRPLKLVQIPLNIVVVIHVFLQLGFPLSTLLFVHEILTVHVVEVNTDLRAVWVTLTTAWHVLLISIKVEPQVFLLD